MMVPEAVRRVESADDDGATCSELREDSSMGKRFREKYCDSQSGGHEDDSPSEFCISLESEVVNEVRRRSLAIMALIAARFFSPSLSDCIAENSLRPTGSPESKSAHPTRDKLMIIQTNHIRLHLYATWNNSADLPPSQLA